MSCAADDIEQPDAVTRARAIILEAIPGLDGQLRFLISVDFPARWNGDRKRDKFDFLKSVPLPILALSEVGDLLGAAIGACNVSF